MIVKGSHFVLCNDSVVVEGDPQPEAGLAYSSVDEVRVVEAGQVAGLDVPEGGARLIVASPSLALHVDYDYSPAAYGTQATIISLMNSRRCYTREQMQRGMHWLGV